MREKEGEKKREQDEMYVLEKDGEVFFSEEFFELFLSSSGAYIFLCKTIGPPKSSGVYVCA